MIQPEIVFKNMYPAGSERPQALTWKVDPQLPYFNGHFPQTPILPAIAIVDASTYLLQCALGRPDLAVQAVTVAKFMSPIVPDQTVHIELHKEAEKEWQIDWKDGSTSAGRLLATLRVQL
jgi:3-hydroxymyristoyl/3-hydroxydecanoyl-(acyl carrier protein) dehydratase